MLSFRTSAAKAQCPGQRAVRSTADGTGGPATGSIRTRANVGSSTARATPSRAGLPAMNDASVNRRALISSAGALLALARPSPSPAKESIFVGQYNDPSHPGCRREIDSQGNVYGADPVPIKPGAPCLPGEPTTPWTLQATVAPDDKTIAIDFDPIDEVKQGPVTGTWTGVGLQLPNGLWTKK